MNIKEKTVKSKGKGFDTLIETGTYLGDMIWAQRNNFISIYSIELSKDLCLRARERFKGMWNVVIFNSDSVTALQTLTSVIPSALFWLDAHYSGGETVRGDKDCPLLDELDIIVRSGGRHGILIDDLRLMGKNGWPTLEEIENILGDFEIIGDIIWKDLR